MDRETDTEWVAVIPPAARLTPWEPRAQNKTGWIARKTRINMDRLLAMLRDPPHDYNGSNKFISQALGVSVFTVSRLMKMLEQEGHIKLKYVTLMNGSEGWYKKRFISVKRVP